MMKPIELSKKPGFQPGKSGNPKGRPRGVPDRRNEWREALAEHLPELIDRLVAQAKSGDEFATKLILERVAPPLRPQGQTIRVPGLDAADGFAAKAEAVLAALGRGQMPIETGRHLLEALATVAKITELDDLFRRVEELERKKEDKP